MRKKVEHKTPLSPSLSPSFTSDIVTGEYISVARDAKMCPAVIPLDIVEVLKRSLLQARLVAKTLSGSRMERGERKEKIKNNIQVHAYH